jgi:hypothetical protein
MSASPTSTERAIATGVELVPPHLVASANSYAKATRAEATRRARTQALAQVRSLVRGAPAIEPARRPETVALYLVALADQGRKVATIV